MSGTGETCMERLNPFLKNVLDLFCRWLQAQTHDYLHGSAGGRMNVQDKEGHTERLIPFSLLTFSSVPVSARHFLWPHPFFLPLAAPLQHDSRPEAAPAGSPAHKNFWESGSVRKRRDGSGGNYTGTFRGFGANLPEVDDAPRPAADWLGGDS